MNFTVSGYGSLTIGLNTTVSGKCILTNDLVFTWCGMVAHIQTVTATVSIIVFTPFPFLTLMFVSLKLWVNVVGQSTPPFSKPGVYE